LFNDKSSDEYFDFSKLTNENFWREVALHSFQAFVFTVRKYWFFFILTSVSALVVGEILYSMQVDKYSLTMTLRYGSIKNGLAQMNSSTSSLGGIGVGANRAGLGAVESFGANFSGVPTPSDTENNFGFNLKDFILVVNSRFVSPESFKEKLRSKKARIVSFEANKSSSLATIRSVGAHRQEVISVTKKLSDYLEGLFMQRKSAIVEKIDERLTFSREEYRLVSEQIKHIEKLEKEFGRTAEVVEKKNTLLTQELSLRASLSEILSYKGEYYIKDFEILNASISPAPAKFLSRVFIYTFSLVITSVLTSLLIILLVFYRLKKITELNKGSVNHTEKNVLSNEEGKDHHILEAGNEKKIDESHLGGFDVKKPRENDTELNQKVTKAPKTEVQSDSDSDKKSAVNKSSFYHDNLGEDDNDK